MKAQAAPRGLEGVVAAASAVSSILGSRLTYRGYDIDDLVEQSTFEETVYLLWTGRLPGRSELEAFEAALGHARALPGGVIEDLARFPETAQVMDRLTAAFALLGLYRAEDAERSPEARWSTGVRIVAQVPVLVAALHRPARGAQTVSQRPDLSTAANFLYLMTGAVPSDVSARILDQVLILHADHELNASTFAARVAASTLSDLHSAVLAALCTLKGPLHGGAARRVGRMLEEIGEPESAAAWVQSALTRRERIPGFGHRVYRDGDPRARALKMLSERLAESSGDRRWYDVSVRLEEEVTRSLHLHPNVDFYSASVYTYLGIPQDLFTPIFAMSRVAGWIAHITEQYADNRLIRPRAEYVGPAYRAYIGLENR